MQRVIRNAACLEGKQLFIVYLKCPHHRDWHEGRRGSGRRAPQREDGGFAVEWLGTRPVQTESVSTHTRTQLELGWGILCTSPTQPPTACASVASNMTENCCISNSSSNNVSRIPECHAIHSEHTREWCQCRILMSQCKHFGWMTDLCAIKNWFVVVPATKTPSGYSSRYIICNIHKLHPPRSWPLS